MVVLVTVLNGLIVETLLVVKDGILVLLIPYLILVDTTITVVVLMVSMDGL